MQTTSFVAFIQKHAGITPSDAAQELRVSVRSIRSYVRKANEAMSSFARIELGRGQGYVLHVDNCPAFNRWMCGLRDANGRADVPQNPQERVTYLLNDLLQRTDWITLDDLTRILFVSRSVLSDNLKEVESRLSRYGLSIEKRPCYGLRVVGPEMARRACLANNVMGSYKQLFASASMAQNQMGGGASPHCEIPLTDVVAACVEEALLDSDFRVASIAYQNLLVHIAVALMRIKSGHSAPMAIDHLNALKQSREFEIATHIADRIERATDIKLPEEEVAYISIHLAGKQTLNVAPEGESGLIISDEVWGVVSEMLSCVWNVFHFDFRNDLELRMNLARHIVPLTVRLKYNMKLDNPLLTDIRLRYPLAYSMAADAASVLAERYGKKLSDDETGYIALAFALAIERQKAEVPKKNILVICASGAGSARLLEYRVRQEFGEYVNSVTCCDALDVSNVDFSTIDYAFTTVPLGEQLPVPVREVKYFLDAEEIDRVKDILRGEDEEPADVLHFFSQDLFYPHLQLFSKQEVLDFLIDEVSAHKSVKPQFNELVWKREGTVATAFGNNVAMPHPLEPASAETFVAVALLDEPVVWDEFGRSVQAVFLSSFAPDGGQNLRLLYGALANLLVSQKAIAALLQNQDWSTLLRLVQESADEASAGGA